MLQAVTDHPSPMFIADAHGVLCLTNQGPTSVFVDDSSSVSPTDGLRINPLGQILWEADRPLWAICNPGLIATLVANPGVSVEDTNRASFWTLAGRVVNPTFFTDYTVETGHCETILVKLTTNVQSSPATDPQTAFLTLKWYDRAGNVIEFDEMRVAQLAVGSGNGYILVRIPVIGSSLALQYSNSSTVTISVLEIFGTDRQLPFRWYCTNINGAPILYYNAVQPIPVQECGDSFAFGALTNFSQRTYMANLGKTLHLGFTVRGVTNAGNFGIRTLTGLMIYATTPTIPVLAGTQFATLDVPAVPQKEPIHILGLQALAGTNYDVAVTWKDD